MILLVVKYLVPKGFRGITFFPFVFLSDKSDKSNIFLVHHERIHLRQQLEMAVVFFFIWYGLEFLFRLLQFRGWKTAYYSISFEREAYQNEKNLDYLKKRSFWSFLRYV
jgi:hypothetical protein